jgi:siroheme synthase
MSLKLGELLINEGVITQVQLDEALKCHIIFGIKLGSSLIELGFIQEDVLLNLLSRKLKVPPVSHAELSAVPSDVIARLSPAVAEKFRVIPIRLENRRLHVAMSDPTDFKAQEELSFITGNIIVPNIAPDIQIFYALEKYYGVKLDHRYVSASCELQKIRNKKPSDDPDTFVTDEGKYTISADFDKKAEPNELINISIPKGLDRNLPYKNSEVQERSNRQSIELYTIDKLSLDFSKARNRDDVADIFIKYLGQEFNRCALLTIRGNSAVGWRALVAGKQVRGFEYTALEISKSSELSEIFIGKHYFFGTLAESPANLPLTTALNLTVFNTILSLPVVMNDRIVAMVVVSSDTMFLQRRLEELQKLVYKASLTFQILVLKNKLLQT